MIGLWGLLKVSKGLPPETYFERLWSSRAGGGEVEYAGAVPFAIESKSRTASEYTIWGNIQQNAAPTPEIPAEVVSVGNKTDNGYEIPVVSRGKNGDRESITTPIYLPEPLYKDDYIVKDKSGGKVHREWGVKVFDGTESFSKNYRDNPDSYLYYCSRSPLNGKKGFAKCTHLSEKGTVPLQDIGITANGKPDVFYFNFGADIMNAQPSGNTVNGFKEFLTSEYAKGTPVTVYYPLETPTEESIALPDLPLEIGYNIIDVGTEIKPEKMSITYKAGKAAARADEALTNEILNLMKEI